MASLHQSGYKKIKYRITGRTLKVHRASPPEWSKNHHRPQPTAWHDCDDGRKLTACTSWLPIRTE